MEPSKTHESEMGKRRTPFFGLLRWCDHRVERALRGHLLLNNPLPAEAHRSSS